LFVLIECIIRKNRRLYRGNQVELKLFAGDAVPTPSKVTVDSEGKIRISEKKPGDIKINNPQSLYTIKLE
jgi:hypothetical protein